MPPSRKKPKIEAEESRQMASETADRAPARRLRGRRGGLKDMLNMPIDVLLEIFAQMHPRDLLSLARTTRELRKFLLSRRAAALSWRAARERQVPDLPPCPAFLSEPMYASLVFETACQSCSKKNTKATWHLAVRLCSRCKQEIVVPASSIKRLLESVRLSGVEGEFLAGTCGIYNSRGERYYLQADVDDFEMAYAMLVSDAGAQLDFAKQAVQTVIDKREFATIMVSWELTQSENKRNALEDLREARLEDIKKRLREAGWGEDLDLMSIDDRRKFHRLPSVSKCQKLTDRGWQNIRAALTEFMQNVKDERLKQERMNLLRARMTTMCNALDERGKDEDWKVVGFEPEIGWVPSFAELALTPEFRTLVEASPDAEITVVSFKTTLPAAIKSWLAAREAEFAAIAAAALPSTETAPDPSALLFLDIMMFQCMRCKHEGMRWPDVLRHRPCATVSLLVVPTDEYGAAVSSAVLAFEQLPVRTSTATTFALSTASAAVLKILRACGKDPVHATPEDMDGLRFVCTICRHSPGQCCVVLDWKRMHLHANSILGVQTSHVPEWEVLDEEHFAIVRQRECSLQSTWGSPVKAHFPESYPMLPEEPYQVSRVRGDGVQLSTPPVWLYGKTSWGRLRNALSGISTDLYICVPAFFKDEPETLDTISSDAHLKSWDAMGLIDDLIWETLKRHREDGDLPSEFVSSESSFAVCKR